MNSKLILILGGNGFIGRCVVEHLLDETNYELILMNRKHWDEWDRGERIRSRVKENIYWDRKTDSITKCLRKYLTDEHLQFEAIIDFSAYKRKEIKNIINKSTNLKFKKYILISTDSVYEVCDANIKTSNLEETDSIRPESQAEREHLNLNDSYGNNKLKCEECLIENAVEFSYIILRLPDVIGPKDSTERFWLHQMYLQYLDFIHSNKNSQIDVLISKEYFNKKTSYVYVKDVAKFILFILKSNISNEIFNIGFETSISIIEFYTILAECIRPGLEKKLNFVIQDKDFDGYPSVNRSISIAKAQNLANFKPTNIREAFKETVDFYNQAYTKYSNERKSIEQNLLKEFLNQKTITTSYKIDFKNFIQKLSLK